MAVKKLIQSKKAWLSVVLVLVTLGFTFGLFGGCGSDYNTPASLTNTPNALIDGDVDGYLCDPSTGWMALGLVNSSGYNNVVILDINGDKSATYDVAHLKGAYYVSTSEIVATRTEGVGVSTPFMVLDGTMMDALIQRTGIGPNTTIVLVSQENLRRPTMLYFAFRYWGFPKNRLKIMDGTLTDWQGAGCSTDAVETPPVNSGYSVRQNPSLRSDLRISFPEMIDIVEGSIPNTVILQGSTSLCCTAMRTGIKGASVFNYRSGAADTLGVVTNDVLHFESAATIQSNLTGAGAGSSTYTVVYCNSGYMAVPIFFALDGILGWPAYYYDGSGMQWGQMADDAQLSPAAKAAGSNGLDTNSPWRTDTPARSNTPIVYSDPFSSYNPSNPLSFDGTVNEIEQEDARYMSTGEGGSAGGGGAGC